MKEPTIKITADAKLLVDCKIKLRQQIDDEIDFLQDIYEDINNFFVCKQIERRIEQLKEARE